MEVCLHGNDTTFLSEQTGIYSLLLQCLSSVIKFYFTVTNKGNIIKKHLWSVFRSHCAPESLKETEVLTFFLE